MVKNVWIVRDYIEEGGSEEKGGGGRFADGGKE